MGMIRNKFFDERKASAMIGKWTTMAPSSPGLYLVCSESGNSFDIVKVRLAGCLMVLSVYMGFIGDWEPLDEYLDNFPLEQLRWLNVEYPPSVDELFASELASI